MALDPLFPLWLIVITSIVAGAVVGVLFERTRGPAAKRAAKFEADLVQARSDLIRYQEDTKRHFGKSAEMLGRMATDYREFLDHFVSGAEQLCGPNLKELDASGLERPLLDTNGAAPGSRASVDAVSTAVPPPAPPLDSDPLIEDAAK
jgi:uncharacterized membrane-anchored protein YhcB (DUF1043 family)